MLTKAQALKLEEMIKDYAEAQNNAYTLGRDHLQSWYDKGKELHKYIESLTEN